MLRRDLATSPFPANDGIDIVQRGTNNAANAQQTGNTGSAIINQTGTNHVANVVQGGNNNAVVINQH